MKVRVNLSIDIDPDAWEDTYPGETRTQAIRRDVKDHTLSVVLGNAPYATGEVPHDIELVD